MQNDPLKNILVINLREKSFEIVKRPELFQQFIGGTGVGMQLLKEYVPPDTDPMSAQNAIILTTGPLVGAFPMASKAVAMFKSPLTKNLGETHAGGRASIGIRSAGLGAVVITEKADIPLYLVIDGHMVFFRDARTLSTMANTRDPRYAISRREKGSGFRTILVTGPAGDNGIAYANVVSETYRHFGRMGLGAVFGSKNLKALQIGGKYAFPVSDRSLYRKVYTELDHRCQEPKFIQKYRELGTTENIMHLNEIGAFPTRNLTATRFEDVEKLSGEYLQTNFLARRIACSHCPVACIHLAALKEKFSPESFFNKTTLVSYDYELVYALGSMLGIGDTNEMLRLLAAVENYGLDAISTGVSLAWTCEAYHKEILSLDQILIPLQWGDVSGFLTAMHHIVYPPTPFYQALGQGSAYAAAHFGGTEFLTTFGQVEMAGYHTGPTQALGFLFGTRHSHLDSGPYSFDLKLAGEKRYPTAEEMINYIIQEESWRQILTSLVVCLFARKIYEEDIVIKALNVMNIPISKEALLTLGTNIYLEKNRYKQACGMNFSNLFPSQRIFEMNTPLGKTDPVFFTQARDLFAEKLKKMM